jgi:hypothetical protein
MQDFIHQKNLEHFRNLLARTQDTAGRELIRKLLAEEEAKVLSPDPGDHKPSSRPKV